MGIVAIRSAKLVGKDLTLQKVQQATLLHVRYTHLVHF